MNAKCLACLVGIPQIGTPAGTGLWSFSDAETVSGFGPGR